MMTNGNLLVPISNFEHKVDHPGIASSSSVPPEIPEIALDKANLFQILPVPCFLTPYHLMLAFDGVVK
jgi:hypothetical protein